MAYQLRDLETIKVLQENLNLIIRENNSIEAYLFAKRLNNILKQSNLILSLDDKILKKYQRMLQQAKFLSLYKLNEQEIFDLVAKHFNIIFTIKSYNLVEKIKDFFIINRYPYEKRDDFKAKIRKILLESNVYLSKDDIDINKIKVPPTIANWLRDFRNQFEEKGFNDLVKLTKYFNVNKNFLSLNKQNQIKIKMLFDLYSYLKKVSFSPEGLEEHISINSEEGDVAILVNGHIEKIPQSVIDIFNEVQKKTETKVYNFHKQNSLENNLNSKKVFQIKDDNKLSKQNVNTSLEELKVQKKKSIEKLLESYKKFELDLKSINPLIKKLEKYKQDFDALLNKFSYDLNKNERDELLAIIIFLCQNKLLDRFFKEHKKLILEFKEYLNLKLSNDIVENIIQNHLSPETLSLYLQFLLFKKLKLSPQNAGLFGMHLANIFKKIGQEKYFSIVYGDLNLERFVWREVIEENGLIKFK